MQKPHHGWTHDVFISFRGSDTRHGFAGNLYNALHGRGINTFFDKEGLQSGEEINSSLFKAIKESRIAILVFSKNYASSAYCLNELVLILKCLKEEGRSVLPIFYDVEPTQVRYQKESYGEAFAKHEKRYSKETLQEWKSALSEAANLSGRPFKPGNEYEFKFIGSITEEVSCKINRTPLHVTDHPVGLESRVLVVKSLLEAESTDKVSMVGIHGIGGIGKTTIARAVYNLISDQFEGVCFLSNVRTSSLLHLQGTLLSKIVGEKDIKLGDVNEGVSIIKSRLHQKKVLVVLDDVDHQKQLQALAGGCDWFGGGSRIIITTRNTHLLARHKVERICEVHKLTSREALQLFSWNAFKKEQVPSSYLEISKRVVSYCSGLPLALEVIGSNFFGKRIDEWNSALEGYERALDKEIFGVLKISYNTLDDIQKEIFLDVACFFKDKYFKDVKDILLSFRGIKSKYAIEVLIDRSLIKIEYSRLTMHDLVEDMGKEIIQQAFPNEPGCRSRLWFYEDILHVLQENTGTDKIEGIILDLPKGQKVRWNGEAFQKMKNLRVLIIKNASFTGLPTNLPDSLTVLDWSHYQWGFLPFNSLCNHNCELPKPLITKNFESLSEMCFSNSEFLEQVPDLSVAPNLNKLYLNNCSCLIEIHGSVGFLSKLRVLSAQRCTNLKTLPYDIKLTSLERLDLSWCSSLQSFPKVLEKMENTSFLSLAGTAIEELPDSICNLTALQFLNLAGCKRLKQLPTSVLVLPKLQMLPAGLCREFKKFSKALWLNHCNLSDESLSMCLSCFSNLTSLDLSFNSFTILPACFKECHLLQDLSVENCEQLQIIEGLPPNLQIFRAQNCTYLTSLSSNMILKQAFHVARKGELSRFIFPGQNVPEWFDHCSDGSEPMCFRVQGEFLALVLCVVVGSNHRDCPFVLELCLRINGIDLMLYLLASPQVLDHVFLFDIQSELPKGELQELLLKDQLNQVEVLCMNQEDRGLIKRRGVYVYELMGSINQTPLLFTDYPGLESRVLKVKSLLDAESTDKVSMVGIYGTVGIGKTTIAQVIYKLTRNQFEDALFLNVRTHSDKHGLLHLRKTLLFGLVGEEDIRLEHRLNQKKVLLVLDDVDEQRQLQALAGNYDWYGSGSRIIITTRNKHLLERHGVERMYEVQKLNDEEALQLFIRNAFKEEPIPPNYLKTSKRAVSYCSGLPLALEVFGSNFYRKGTEEWNSALDHLDGHVTAPDKEIFRVLKISFEALNDFQKEIFLDVACFFKGEKLNDVKDMLRSIRGITSEYAIGVLIDKSLIKIDYGHLTMHDLVQDMGKKFIQQESLIEPGNRSRLWSYKNILHILQRNTGINNVESIILDLPKGQKVQWNGKAFEKMKNLIVLIIRDACFSRPPTNLPNSLRVLEWTVYEWESLPPDFHPTHLVRLKLSNSSCGLLKPFTKNFESLIEMHLSHSQLLTQVPDLSGVPNLQELHLDNCPCLIEIHDSVGTLSKLRVLSAEGCTNLRTLPHGIKLTSLERLNFSHCSSLRSFPEVLEKMEKTTELFLSGTAIEELPNSICNLTGLRWLELSGCEHLKQLPTSVLMLPKLETFNASNCTPLISLSSDMLLNQAFHIAGTRRFILPGQRVPEWFHHYSDRESMCFWVRGEFPDLLLCFVVVGDLDDKHGPSIHLSIRINGIDSWFYLLTSTLVKDHIFLLDLQRKLPKGELQKVLLKDQWNQVKLLCMNQKKGGLIKQIGVYVYKDKGKNLLVNNDVNWDSNSMVPASTSDTISGQDGTVQDRPAKSQPENEVKRFSVLSNIQAPTTAIDDSSLNQIEPTLEVEEMVTFFASLDLNLVQASEDNQRSLERLKNFLSIDFSELLSQGQYSTMKATLEYLSNLSADGGISGEMRSVITELSRKFTHWRRDYEDASRKIELTTADLLRADKLQEGLEVINNNFWESKRTENELCNKLTHLEERKRELEEQLNAIKDNISVTLSDKEMAAKRMRETYKEAKTLKAQIDELRPQVPRLRDEQESAKEIQTKIEDEWSKLKSKLTAML